MTNVFENNADVNTKYCSNHTPKNKLLSIPNPKLALVFMHLKRTVLNTKDSKGRSVLTYATFNANEPLAKALISKGSNVKGNAGKTLLMMAMDYWSCF